jgi:5-enolpyruvylshikimate-3-phosphate synthase
LRHKESDRIATMTTELRKMGVSIQETPDGLATIPHSSAHDTCIHVVMHYLLRSTALQLL